MRRRVVFTLLQYTTGGASRGLQHVMLLAMAVPDGTGSAAAAVLDRGGVAALDEVQAVRDGARVEGVRPHARRPARLGAVATGRR